MVRGLFFAVASYCRAQALGMGSSVVEACGTVAVVHRLNCSMACGIFPDHGWNLCPLHWQVNF